jgi:hypothetical protein
MNAQEFGNFDILTEIKDNWWFLLKVLGNLYLKPFQPNYITDKWDDIVNTRELNLTCFLSDKLTVTEFTTDEKTKEFYTKVYTIKKFDYKRFNEYYKVSPGILLQNLRARLVGRTLDPDRRLELEYAGTFAIMLEYLLRPSDLQNSLDSSNHGTKDLEKLIVDINKNYEDMVNKINRTSQTVPSKNSNPFKNFDKPGLSDFDLNAMPTKAVPPTAKQLEKRRQRMKKHNQLLDKNHKRQKLDDLFASNFRNIFDGSNFGSLGQGINKMLKEESNIEHLQRTRTTSLIKSSHDINQLIQKYKEYNQKPTVYLLNFFMEGLSEGFSEGEEYYKLIKKIQEQ